MQGSKIRDSVISVAIRTRGPCSMKALSDVLRRKDRDSRKMCAILLQIPSDPEKMACSALLPLPLCFSYKIAINKMSKLRDLPLLLGCGYFHTGFKIVQRSLCRVIDSYSGSRGAPHACFQALDFSSNTSAGRCTLSWPPKAPSREEACLCECVRATDAWAGGTLLCICWHQLYSLKVCVCLVSQKQTPNPSKQDLLRAYVQKHTDN